MTRASEFCYIAERRDGVYLLAMMPLAPGLPCLWTDKPDDAMRHTFEGIRKLQGSMGATIGFRKVLAG